MKKIGIITLNGNINYGNRLQNYALKTFLEKMNKNIYVETIWYVDLRKIKNYLKHFIEPSIYRKRYKRIKKFSKKNLNIKYYFCLKNFSHNYNYIIVGSDQVWNYNFPSVNKDLVFLKYSPKCKNIAYAASIGIDKLPNNMISEYKIGLSNFKKISVREDSGKQIIDQIGIDCPTSVLIDPTMLLSLDDWNSLVKKTSNVKNIPKKYILKYFLGKTNDNIIQDLKEFAKQNDAVILDILNPKSEFYCCDPSEFLYLEKNAFLICTDSFHSSVFAIVFNVPFIVYNREDFNENMNTRIDNLLNKLKLNDRKYSGKLTQNILNYDYEHCYKIIELEREKSKNFIMSSIE